MIHQTQLTPLHPFPLNHKHNPDLRQQDILIAILTVLKHLRILLCIPQTTLKKMH